MPYDFSTPISFRNAGAGGQYGYVDGLPVLNASIADQVIQANNGYVTGDAAGTADNAMGWDTGSVNGVLTNGAGVYGIRKEPQTDSEGQPTGSFTYSGDMDAAARQLGLNVTGLNDEQKYNLINNATQNLYLVSGKTGRDAGGIGEQYEGRTQTAAIPNATTNHATVLYRREGDALVPITQTAQYYNGEMELSPGSGLSDFISFAAPIALMAFPGVGTALGTALGATGATASALGGAIIGGGLSAATGGNVLQGAALGGLGGYAGNYFQSPGSTDYLGSAALGDASTGAVGSGSTGFGINPNAAGVGINAGTNAALANALSNYDATASSFGLNPARSTSELGSFNASNVSAPGINTSSLGNMEYLGGTGSLPVGTAGLTAEQLGTATALGQVGTNSASGMGYLGGASSLPAGTAGITGVSGGGLSASDLNNARRLANALTNTGQSFANAAFPQTGIGQGYSMPNPFFTPKEVQTMAETKTNQPVYLGQLAQLLRG